MIRRILEQQFKRGNKERLTLRLSRNIIRAPEQTDCILWAGAINNDGYGKMNFRHEGRIVQLYAHRVFWTLYHGREPDEGKVIDHLCKNRRCCNVAHLRLVSVSVNNKRRRKPMTLAEVSAKKITDDLIERISK